MLEKKFVDIYEAHVKRVYNLALHYLQNQLDAEEVTQEVFVKVYQSFDSFREESQLSTWIHRICVNLCLDNIKAAKRKKRFAFLSSLSFHSGENRSIEPVNFNHPGIQLENKEAFEKLFQLINELPEKQKTALILCKIEKFSQAEAAKIMELTPKAVESLIQRAKVNLKSKIDF